LAAATSVGVKTVGRLAEELKGLGLLEKYTVIVGEHGNDVHRHPGKRPRGHGGVWYPESALRMRVRNWVAFFSEIVFIFWNTSYARDGHYMNIWLGPQERQYIKAMQDFVYRLDPGVRMVPVTVSEPEAVRG
jgi:hypothetical protein